MFSQSLSQLWLLTCRCSLHFRVEVGFRQTLRWLMCQDAVQPSGSDAVEPEKTKISHIEKQETRKSGCQCVLTACYCVCQLAIVLVYPVEQETAISRVDMRLNQRIANADLRGISSSLIRYQPVAPRKWTDPLLSKLWELPSLAGKLPVCLRPPVSAEYDGCSQ